MKKFYLIITTLLIVVSVSAQNPLLILPNNYLDPNLFPTPLPTPYGAGIGWPAGYDGRSPSVAHNVQHDANGELLFFIVDGHIFDKDGLLISDVLGGNFGADEIVVIPVPNKCNKYYIVGAEHTVFGTNCLPRYFMLDLELPGQFSSPTGALTTPSNFNLEIAGNWNNTLFNSFCNFACTPIINNEFRYLYILAEYNLLRYKVDEFGIQYDNFSHPIEFRGGGGPSFTEMEIFHDADVRKYYIAFAWRKQQLGAIPFNHPAIVVHHTELNANPALISTNNSSNPNNWSVQPSWILDVIEIDYGLNINAINSEHRKFFFQSPNNPLNSLEDDDIRGIEFINNQQIIIAKNSSIVYPENLLVMIHNNAQFPKVANHPNFINESTFKKSYIETGVDGNLYMHNGSFLAQLNTAGTTGTAFWQWNPQLLQFNYSIPTSIDDNVSPYFLQDQIDNENSLTIAQGQNVCCQNYQFSSPDNDIIISGGNVNWSANNNPFNNSPNSVIVNGSITISSGTNLTISNLQFYFKENTRVTIERGASLTMNNTLFTSEECATYLWQGVIVKGNPALPPTFTNQGTLVMQNNSEISNAIRGVRNFGVIDVFDPNTQTTSQQPDFGNSGGQLYIDQSTFRNNKKDVEMFPYSQSNQGYFRRTTFITDAVLNDGSPCDTHLSLFGVRNVKVEGCKFKNTVPGQFAFIQRGFGITAADASFIIDKNLPTGTTSEFENLYYGIWASAVNPINNTSVKNTLFKECHRGLYFKNIDYTVVVNNVFEVGETFNTVNTGTSYGAYFQNCTGYKISDNLFNSDYHLTQDVRGLLINNSNENGLSADANNVVRNDFDRLRYGSWAFNANVRYQNILGTTLVLGSSGLSFKCNEYKDITQGDIMITNGGIKPQQGSCLSSTSGANNQFSTQFTTALNFWNGNSNVTPFSSKYFYNPSIPLSHNPLITNIFNTIKTSCTTLPYNPIAKGNCNSAIVTGPLIVLKSLSDSLKTAGEAKENFYSALDTYVNNQWSTYQGGQLSVGNLKNNLSTKSPYLNVTILEAIVQSNMAPGIKKQLLLENSPLPASVITLVQQSNIPNGIKNQILSAQNGGTNPRVIADAEASDLIAESKIVLNEAIRYHIHDTTSLNGLDSAIILLKSREELVYRKQLADAYIENNEFNNAQQILDSLKLVDNGAHLEFAKMRELLIAFEQCQERGFRIEHDSIQRTELESIVLGDPFRRECVSAQVIFEMVTKIRVDEEIPFYTVPKSYTPTPQNLTSASQMASIYVYPNPANDYLTVELMDETENAVITIYSILGSVMKTIRVNQSIQQIDVSDLEVGIYLVTSTLSDGSISTERIVIER